MCAIQLWPSQPLMIILGLGGVYSTHGLMNNALRNDELRPSASKRMDALKTSNMFLCYIRTVQGCSIFSTLLHNASQCNLIIGAIYYTSSFWPDVQTGSCEEFCTAHTHTCVQYCFLDVIRCIYLNACNNTQEAILFPNSHLAMSHA